MSLKKTKVKRGKDKVVAPAEQQGQPTLNRDWRDIASGNKKHPLSAAVQRLLDSKETPETRARATVDDFYKDNIESYIHDIDCLVEDADADADPVFDKPPEDKPLAKVLQLKRRKIPASNLKN